MDTGTVMQLHGECRVPMGKLLWTWQASDFSPSTMEFNLFTAPQPDFQFGQPRPGCKKITLQATQDLTLVAPFDIKAHFVAISLLPRLYSDVLGQPWPLVQDRVVEFKDTPELREPLLRALDALGIDGWLHPIQSDPCAVEVCVGCNVATKVQSVRSRRQIDERLYASPGHAAQMVQDPEVRVTLARHHRLYVRATRNAWCPFQGVYLGTASDR